MERRLNISGLLSMRHFLQLMNLELGCIKNHKRRKFILTWEAVSFKEIQSPQSRMTFKSLYSHNTVSDAASNYS